VRDQRVHVTAADLRRVRRAYRHLRGIAGHNVKPYSDLADAAPDLRYFTYLRDPVRRYLSHYLNRSGSHTRAGFEQWAAAGWTHDWQTKMVAGEASAQKAIDLLASRVGFVGLTETFDESLLMLAQWLGEPGFRPEYRPVNRLADKSRARDAAREHTDLGYLELPEVCDRLREINALDQQVYDFAVREACARQRQAYRGRPRGGRCRAPGAQPAGDRPRRTAVGPSRAQLGLQAAAGAGGSPDCDAASFRGGRLESEPSAQLAPQRAPWRVPSWSDWRAATADRPARARRESHRAVPSSTRASGRIRENCCGRLAKCARTAALCAR